MSISNKTNLGIDIPDKWEKHPIGDYFEERIEFTSDLNTYKLCSLLIDGGIVNKTDRYNREHLLKNSDENLYKIVHPDDVVFNPMNLRYGAIAKSNFVHPVCVSGYYNVIKTKSNIGLKYFEDLFKSNKMLHVYDRVAIGSLVEKRRIHLSIFQNIEIAVPPKEELITISEILLMWDRAIEKTKYIIGVLTKRNDGLKHELLFGIKRLNEYKKVEWISFKLGELFQERLESGYVNLPLLSITGDYGVVHRDKLAKRDTSNEDKSKYKRICIGDIGYNTMRMWQGRSAVSNFEGIVSPAYTIIFLKVDMDVNFFGYLFKMPSVINSFFRHSEGLVKDTLNCKYENFAQVKIFIPKNKTEQIKISQVISTADKELNYQKKRLELLQLQKVGLMQKLLTGQIRVRN